MARVGRATIRDVAQHAGVSVSTVSKVVNSRDGIATATRERVRASVEELGFFTSIGARSLRAHRTGVVGVLISEFEPYATEVIKGIAQEGAGSGYEVMAWSGGSGLGIAPSGWERGLVARLAGSLIDAAVLVTPSVAGGALEGFPVVAVDPHEGPGQLPTVHSDDYAGALAAVRHLLELGHRRIGFLGGRAGLMSASERERGYRDGLVGGGVRVDESLVVRGDYTARGASGPAALLLTLPEPPTAVFAANDVSALCLLELAGDRVPGSLSVVGFDNIPESALATPQLTTIAQPLRTIGVEAMAMVLAQLRGERIPQHVTLPTTLMVRGTTAPPAR